jgi:uncharacterized membrane protein
MSSRRTGARRVEPDRVAAAPDLARNRDARRRAREAARHDGGQDRLLRSRWGRVLVGSVVALALATLIGLVALWPHGSGPAVHGQALGGATRGATVSAERTVKCDGPVAQRCREVEIRVGGERATVALGPVDATPSYAAGDRVRVRSAGAGTWSVVGADRRGTLLWLTVAFAALVVALTRRRGVLALGGFALSLLLVTKFVVPAILDGRPAMLVALVGSSAVMFVTVLLTYGVSAQSAAAVLGIAGSLLFAAVLGTVAVDAARLDGRSGELSIALSQAAPGLSLQGVVLAGLVIGALGVLADMAVTQASAVMALRRANPAMGAGRLFREGYAVGRDHLVATTHTLVLAYVGATLPLLLVLQSFRVPAADLLNSQEIAEPIVATLVGAMALLVSVPLSTALAAGVAARIPAAALPDAAHGHHH